MLEMLAESFSGCVYMYVRVLWRLLASPRLASAVYCPQTPPHTPLVNGCSHPSPSLRNRLHAPGRGQIDWCALSLQKDLNSICLQWLQFPGQPKSALFFLRLFFFSYSSWRTVISFHYFVWIHLPSPPTIHPATEISVCEYMCVCVHMCVSWEHRNLFVFKPRCHLVLLLNLCKKKKRMHTCLCKDLPSWFHSMCIIVGSKILNRDYLHFNLDINLKYWSDWLKLKITKDTWLLKISGKWCKNQGSHTGDDTLI